MRLKVWINQEEKSTVNHSRSKRRSRASSLMWTAVNLLSWSLFPPATPWILSFTAYAEMHKFTAWNFHTFSCFHAASSSSSVSVSTSAEEITESSSNWWLTVKVLQHVELHMKTRICPNTNQTKSSRFTVGPLSPPSLIPTQNKISLWF